MKVHFALALVALGLVGCSSYKKDLQTMCDAPSKATIPPGADASQKAVAMAAYIDDNIKSSEGRATFSGLAAVSPSEKGRTLRAEATKNGITSCALADFYDAPTPPTGP